MGSQSIVKLTRTSSQSAAGLLNFSCAIKVFWPTKAVAAISTQMQKVQRMTALTVATSWRRCVSVIAADVCWAKTICNPSAGMVIQFNNWNRVPTALYSALGRILETMHCTAHMKKPPATVAIIIQPLCRKKFNLCEASVICGVSNVFSASMRRETLTENSPVSRKGSKKCEQHVLASFERGQGNPFVNRMGLGH